MWCTNVPLRAGLVALLVAYAGLDTVEAQVASPPLGHETALERARANNHLLRSAELRIDEASGELSQAAVFLMNNPEIAVTSGRRSSLTGPSSFDPEFEVGIEQRLEIGGQRGGRTGFARAGLEASRAEASDAHRVVALATSLAFFEGIAARERVVLAERNEGLADDLNDLAQRRLDVGVGTPLELNAAVVRLAEARRSSLEARGNEEAVLLRLRRLIGADPDEPITLSGALPEAAPQVPVDDVVAQALTARPDLLAAAHRVDAAEAAARLAGAQAWPDVTIGASLAQEEGDELLRAGVRLPLTLFNRNQGTRAATQIARERRAVEREGLALAVVSDVRTTALLYEQARTALQLYDADVLTALQESAGLVELAAEAGELSIADVLVVQRELVDGMRGYLDARLSLATARARLLAAASLPQTTDLQGDVR